ncbi:interleukin-18 isoform X3 [Pipistrellus kuhlii]|uniref:interleukin-18 isoform X3 n=1 Tax=Pipistrellus kuhlii TaxID=59472 RepID=UPI00174F3725|nr:interleukin-18 isoform X3 [Pipistrellus kuhlii]
MGKVGAIESLQEVDVPSPCPSDIQRGSYPYLACDPLTDVQIVKENLESDYFGKIERRWSIIRNLNNQVLFVDQRRQAIFEDMTDSECRENPTKIVIHIYKDSHPRGLAVALSVKSKENFTISCKDKIISFKEMSPPDNINNEENEIIFFMRSVPGHDNKMQFESSLYRGYFLACKKENELFKLTLKERDIHGDESVMFIVEYGKY